MKTYSVDLQYTNYVTLFVQAETEAQAKILAWKEAEQNLHDEGDGHWDTLDVEEWIPKERTKRVLCVPFDDSLAKILSADWSKTTAVFDGEDWRFENVPLEVCPNWRGSTCFSERELGVRGDAAPDAAIRALQVWVGEEHS